MRIAGSRCVIVAGRRGLGREIAVALSTAGADVAVSSRTTAAPLTTADAAHATVGRVVAVTGGVSTAAGATDLICDAAAALGGLDAVVFAAGAPFRPQPPHEVDETAFDAVFDTLVKGFYYSAVAAHDLFVAENRDGVVVGVTDVMGIRPWAAFAAHCAAKAAQSMLVRSLALAWADDGVRVCAVAPGPLALADDPRADATARAATRTPLGRAGDPAEVAAAVRFCIENDYLTGNELVVDGGASLH